MKIFATTVLLTMLISHLEAISQDTDSSKTSYTEQSNSVMAIEGGLGIFSSADIDGIGWQGALSVQKDSDQRGGFMPGGRLSIGIYNEFVISGAADTDIIPILSLELLVPYRFFSYRTGLFAEVYCCGVLALGAYETNEEIYGYDRIGNRHSLFHHFGAKIGIGFGYTPVGSNAGFIIHPINLTFGSGEYVRIEATLGFEFYLE